MAKLYFKYGAMGSSKTANALITKFNYEERGMKVMLLKPATDDRDGVGVVKSRIGLEAKAKVVSGKDSILALYQENKDVNVVIVDECQFLTEEQIDELRYMVDEYQIPVLCYGLRTDFQTKVFPGSLRLFEVADSISEIKTICTCGSKAVVNARLGEDGRLITDGEQVCIGGNERYIAMCHACYKKAIRNNEIVKA